MSSAVRVLHLAALWAFAFVQPLLDLLGRQAQFFVARGNTSGDIVVLALAIALVPPAIMGTAVWLVGRARPALGWGLQLALVGVLAAAMVLPPAGELLSGSVAALAVAALLGAGAAALYARAPAARAFLTVLGPAPAVFVVLFLAFSSASKLVLPDEARAVGALDRSRTPVVMVVFDELPTTTLMGAGDRIDGRRFPAFAALAEHGTWYRNATSVAPGTTEAVPALLTGRDPREGLLPTASDHPRNLFTLLGRSHRLAVSEPLTELCPAELCARAEPGMGTRLRALATDLRVVSAHLLLPEDLRGGLPAIDRDWEGFAAEAPEPAPDATPEELSAFRGEVVHRVSTDDPTLRFRRLLAAMGSRGRRPPLVFWHSTLPHGPWRYFPDGRRYSFERAPFPGLEQELWVGPQWLVDQAYQRHIAQAQYADRLLGQLLDRLRSDGLYDRALIVVTADHGVSFRAGEPRRTPSAANLVDVAGVPLIVKAPGQRRSRVDDSAARTTDVLPTIADELGIRVAWPFDGMPAGDRDEDPSARIETFGGHRQVTSLGAFLRARAARQRAERALEAPASLYAMGPAPELVGREVEDLGRLPAGGGRVRLDAPAGYPDVGTDVLPAFVSGGVSGVPEGGVLAVAVNGRVEATTRVQGEGSFTALVRPDSLRPGANAVEVFEVARGGLRPRLVSLRS
ncbi:MAG: sulfatase-like hydrolase/transferase [Solirubrobacteraceae bacterium]